MGIVKHDLGNLTFSDSQLESVVDQALDEERRNKIAKVYTASSIECDLWESYITLWGNRSSTSGILDCGCTHNVAGSNWINRYLENLKTFHEQEFKNVRTRATARNYLFGSDHKTAINTFIIPIFPVGVRVMIEIDVVEDSEAPSQ